MGFRRRHPEPPTETPPTPEELADKLVAALASGNAEEIREAGREGAKHIRLTYFMSHVADAVVEQAGQAKASVTLREGLLLYGFCGGGGLGFGNTDLATARTATCAEISLRIKLNDLASDS